MACNLIKELLNWFTFLKGKESKKKKKNRNKELKVKLNANGLVIR